MLELWIARNINGNLYLYRSKPLRMDGYFTDGSPAGIWNIEDDLFPEVTWENSPRKVKIELV